ncbi:WD repeat-containing protein 64-like isoform X1 [Scyliorhinus canicula]|uniref:WD repeat-containing protein 64-like isoform X1 n=1 Tax=Scyliorhinus canicula TaxID=7830 RepID=UPI0018F35AB7|nr:WD repeat-containing protein 64-like isoform X1 [Scyliorhinus canicula]
MSVDNFVDHGLDAPFLLPIFKERLDQFNNLIALIVRQIKMIDSNKRTPELEPMTYDEFYDTVQDLFHDELKSEYIKAIFKKININLEAPIDWCELFGYFPSDDSNIFDIPPVFLVSKRQQVELREEEKRRHDHIQSIVKVPQLDQVLAATLKGMILLYSSQMKLQAYTDIGDISQVTGCDYLSQLKRIITVTETSIVIWDHKPKTKNQTNFLTIKPMKNIILCICTVNLPEYLNEDCMLIGDDAGFLNQIIVGTEDLNLQKSRMESNVLQSQALDPRLLRRPILRRKLHDGWVLRVKYIPHLNCFACCSPDSIHSLVLDDIRKLGDCQPIRTLSTPRGVNAFDYCVKANTIVTGGEDKILRLWNPNMFSKPKALLYGHSCIITEVVINESDQHIISLSTEGMFRIWDVQTLAVLQVFSLGERKGDRHFNTMIFDSKTKRLITGSNAIDLIPLMSAVHDTMLVPLSHEKSINVLLYNRMNSKVVSICSKSVIMVWELQTGQKVYQIVHPHGHAIEVTAGAIDPLGTQLITGAVDGSVTMWDFYTGEKLKSFTPLTENSEEDNRISQLFFLNDGIPQLILIFGWKNKIKMIQDTPEELNLTMLGQFPDIITAACNNTSFTRKELQDLGAEFNPGKEGDLADMGFSGIDFLNVNEDGLLAIGWLNLIMLWNLESASLLQIFNKGQLPEMSNDVGEQDFMQDVKPSKVELVKFVPLKLKKADIEIIGISGTNMEFHSQASNMTVAKLSKLSLMFKFTDSYAPSEYSQSDMDMPSVVPHEDLNIAVATLLQPNPILLSAHQDGSIQFWSTEGKQLAKILPTIQFSSPIIAVCVDDHLTILIAGNQRGHIIIWDIAEFLDEPYTSNKDSINRLISWRAHTLHIVSLFYVEETSVVVSASIDCSIRVWYAPNGHYIGYFGQHSLLVLVNPSDFALPCDITETPVESKSKKSGKSDELDYPLMFDWERWKPFDRDAYNLKLTQQRKVLDLDHDKKLFKSVTIPRLKSKPIENSISGTRAMGAVFRALPVYTIDPLFQINPFDDISVTPKQGGQDSLHNFFAGERKVLTNVKKETKLTTLNPIKTCHIFNASPNPPAYVML